TAVRREGRAQSAAVVCQGSRVGAAEPVQESRRALGVSGEDGAVPVGSCRNVERLARDLELAAEVVRTEHPDLAAALDRATASAGVSPRSRPTSKRIDGAD